MTGRAQVDHRRRGPRHAVHPMADWPTWVRDAHRIELPWAPAGAELLEVLPVATDLIAGALADPALPRCLIHRDVNSLNFLRTKDGPTLCDFGYAGPDVTWLKTVDNRTYPSRSRVSCMTASALVAGLWARLWSGLVWLSRRRRIATLRVQRTIINSMRLCLHNFTGALYGSDQ